MVGFAPQKGSCLGSTAFGLKSAEAAKLVRGRQVASHYKTKDPTGAALPAMGFASKECCFCYFHKWGKRHFFSQRFLWAFGFQLSLTCEVFWFYEMFTFLSMVFDLPFLGVCPCFLGDAGGCPFAKSIKVPKYRKSPFTVMEYCCNAPTSLLPARAVWDLASKSGLHRVCRQEGKRSATWLAEFQDAQNIHSCSTSCFRDPCLCVCARLLLWSPYPIAEFYCLCICFFRVNGSTS